MMNQRPLPAYDIHPVSIKMIRKGHPWVLKDKFTEKFHPRDRFIVARDKRRPFALLIHDPTHKSVKARIWSERGDFNKQIKNFKNDLNSRLRNAITKRVKAELPKKRDNFYLVFGEGDQLPGLHIIYVKGKVLIQLYSFFWENYKEYLMDLTLKNVRDTLNEDMTKADIWVQKRDDGEGLKTPATCIDPNKSYEVVEINEHGVTLKAYLGKFYDIGVYTDMASVRDKIKSIYQGKKVLNLFAYSGAFSLAALHEGASAVTSVDLSEEYLELLEQNLKLNPEIDSAKHRSLCTSTQDFLKEAAASDEKYDFIICDPPTSSSDGVTRVNALREYKSLLPQMEGLLSENGKILVFLNSHRVSPKKFEGRLREVLEEGHSSLKITKRFKLDQDCPMKKGFPEGSYLKGLLLEHDQD